MAREGRARRIRVEARIVGGRPAPELIRWARGHRFDLVVTGRRGGLLLTAMALAATSNTVLLMMLSVTRSLYGMASAGALPRALARVGRRHTPWVATAATALVAAGFALAGNLAEVANLSNGAVLILFAMVNLALVRLWRRGEAPGDGKRMALPAAGAATCLGLLPYVGWHGVLFGLGMAGFGVLAGGYLGGRRGGGKPPPT